MTKNLILPQALLDKFSKEGKRFVTETHRNLNGKSIAEEAVEEARQLLSNNAVKVIFARLGVDYDPHWDSWKISRGFNKLPFYQAIEPHMNEMAEKFVEENKDAIFKITHREKTRIIAALREKVRREVEYRFNNAIYQDVVDEFVNEITATIKEEVSKAFNVAVRLEEANGLASKKS